MGGRQRSPRSALDHDQGWYGYGSAHVVRVDGTGPREVFSYVSPPDACLPTDPVLFKTGAVRGRRMYLPTQTEILVVTTPDFALQHRITLPCFNDVHHVAPIDDDSFYVVNTGLEMVLRVAVDGTVQRIWNVMGEDPWERFDKHKDYRFGCSTKPHLAHPNYLFVLGDEPFATRFELRDAVSLNDPSRRIDIGNERLHDGVVADGRIYFTTVDGHVIIADAQTLRVTERIALDPGERKPGTLGWCRGLFIEGDYAWVGFTRVRATRFRSVLSYVRAGYLEAPTRIARYHLRDWSLVSEVDLEDVGLNALFGIVRV
jgi:hypothetical protein